MQTNQTEMFAAKFADCMARLKALGLKAEIAVCAGVVVVSTQDKGSASCFRKAIKTASERAGAFFVENRPAKGSYVFTVKV